MPVNEPIAAFFGLLFRDRTNARFPGDRPENRVYVNLLIRPIAKIRLIQAYFETEPHTGSDWIQKR